MGTLVLVGTLVEMALVAARPRHRSVAVTVVPSAGRPACSVEIAG